MIPDSLRRDPESARDRRCRRLRGSIDETEGGLLAVNSVNGVMAELGVSAVDADGKFRPVDEVLAQVQERMSKLASDGENAARLTKLFGRAGGELAPPFNLSAQEFGRFRVEAQRLGVTLSQDNVNQVREPRARRDVRGFRRALRARGAGPPWHDGRLLP